MLTTTRKYYIVKTLGYEETTVNSSDNPIVHEEHCESNGYGENSIILTSDGCVTRNAK